MINGGSSSRRGAAAGRSGLVCGVALVAGATIGLSCFYAQSGGWPVAQGAATPLPARPLSSRPLPDLATRARTLDPAKALAAAAGPTPQTRVYGALLDPAFVGGRAPLTFAATSAGTAQLAFAAPEPTPEPAAATPAPEPAPTRTASLEEPVGNDADDTSPALPALPPVPPLARDVPLPLRRPAALAEATREERASEPTRAPVGHRAVEAIANAFPQAQTPQPQQPGLLDRLFGRTGGALAYAAPEDNGIGLSLPGRAAYDRYTAIYNISTHTVILPDGTRLEAHSGLGPAHDDPRSAGLHMRGVTPPNLYDLTLRESLFHGVQALRLTPVGGGGTYGRGGLLAHTFMLGPRGDSNGCVVFRNYQAFLAAYQSGAVRRLAVVAGGV